MRIFIILCIFITPFAAQSQARRALALIEKGKTEEAYQLLQKELVKDSLASAEKYVLSTLFNNTEYINADLDSAYFYILYAIKSFESEAEKSKIKLNNNGFTTEVFAQLKTTIEGAGFERAKKGGTEQDYIDFLSEFSTSSQIDSAIILRDSEGFKIAEKTNTFSSYKQFYEKYPKANEATEAKKRYEKLLFEDKTVDGKLKSYQDFLGNYPDTWHRRETEKKIYDILTGKNSVEAYAEFVDLYPQSYLKDKATVSQYAILNEGLLTNSNLTSQQKDSISVSKELSEKLIIPILHNNKYQLIDANNTVITEKILKISNENKCSGPLSSLILAEDKDGPVLLSLPGSVLAKGDILSYKDEGRGLIKITSSKDQHFVHTGGFRTNSNNYNNASIVWPYIAFEENEKWGIESITGISMLEAKYDSIFSFHDNLILIKEKQWGIFPANYFYPLLDGNELEFKLAFDEILILNQEYLLLVKGKKNSLVNKEGHVVVPMEEQSIEIFKDGYFIDRVDSLMDSRISENWYYDINYNQDWTLGDHGDTQDIYFQREFLWQANGAKTAGISAILITSNDSSFFYFNDSTKILLKKGESILPIRKMGQNSTGRHFIITNAKKKQKVFNSQGKVVKINKFDKLIDLGDAYMLREIKKSYDLLNDSGKVVLKAIDAATSLNNGYISYLSGDKFGLYNEKDSTLIEAKYDKPIIAYSDSLFIAIKENMYGIINRHDSLLVKANYNEIKHFNDSIAILNSNFRWVFWDLRNHKPLLDNVSDYWLNEVGKQKVLKIFKGVGYGIWTPDSGLILKPTFSEINIASKGDKVVYIAEKWVEEADIAIMLYYNKQGDLFRKEILSTAEYQELTCKTSQD